MIISTLSEKEKSQLFDMFPENMLRDCDICIGALNGDDLCGVLTAKIILKKCWDITFLYVDDTWRRHHIAEDMLRLLFQTVRRLGAGAVTMSFVKEKERDDLFDFAVRNGFETVSESGVLGSTLSSVGIAISDLRKLKKFQGMFLTLDKASEAQWNSLTDILQEKRSEQDKKRGDKSGMLYIAPEPKNYYKTDVSILALDKKGIPVGALLMREGENFLSVDYLVSFIARDPDFVLNLMKACCETMEKYYNDIDIHFHTYNPIAEKLARTLLGRFIKELGRAVYMIKYM